MAIQKQGAGADRVAKKIDREHDARAPQNQENTPPQIIDQDQKDLGETNEQQPNPNEARAQNAEQNQSSEPDFFHAYEELVAAGSVAPVFGQINPAQPAVVQSPDIDQLVADAVAKLVAKGVINIPAAAAQVQPPAPEVPKYKKHYRNDLNPDLIIQALDMSALDRGERPQANPVPGKYIRFRLGHLYTNDDNTIRQLDYMSTRPMYNSDGETVGGNPAIYEDDGEVVFRCTAGCEDAVFASKKAYKAHMRGLHGVDIN